MYRPVPRALMMVFPTRAVPLKTPETVIDGWASLRGGIESKDLTPLAILSPSAFAELRTCRCTRPAREENHCAHRGLGVAPDDGHARGEIEGAMTSQLRFASEP